MLWDSFEGYLPAVVFHLGSLVEGVTVAGWLPSVSEDVEVLRC